VAAFAARLQDAVDPDAVRADLLGVVQRSLEPVHVSAWLGPRLAPGTLILNEEWEHRLYAERDLAVLEARRLDITSDGQSLRWPMRRGQSFP
jgi:hypothetical protein